MFSFLERLCCNNDCNVDDSDEGRWYDELCGPSIEIVSSEDDSLYNAYDLYKEEVSDEIYGLNPVYNGKIFFKSGYLYKSWIESVSTGYPVLIVPESKTEENTIRNSMDQFNHCLIASSVISGNDIGNSLQLVEMLSYNELCSVVFVIVSKKYVFSLSGKLFDYKVLGLSHYSNVSM